MTSKACDSELVDTDQETPLPEKLHTLQITVESHLLRTCPAAGKQDIQRLATES